MFLFLFFNLEIKLIKTKLIFIKIKGMMKSAYIFYFKDEQKKKQLQTTYLLFLIRNIF